MAPSELCHHLNCHLNCCHHQELFVLMALTALALAQVMPPCPSEIFQGRCSGLQILFIDIVFVKHLNKNPMK